jgi:hypothetical protein
VAAGKKRRTSGDGSGYGYVVWADRDSGGTSECKMSSGSVMPSLLRNSPPSVDKRPENAVLAAELYLALFFCDSMSPDGLCVSMHARANANP